MGNDEVRSSLSTEAKQRRNFTSTASIRKTAFSFEAEIGHSWDVIGFVRRAFLITQSSYLVGVCRNVLLGVTFIDQPIGKISTVAWPIANSTTV
jgi:hypothetical protein